MIQLVAITFHLHICAAHTHLQRNNMSWYLTRLPEKSSVYPILLLYDTSCSNSAFHFHIFVHIVLQTSIMSWYLTRSPERSSVHPRINYTDVTRVGFYFLSHICAHIDLQTNNMSRRICALHAPPTNKDALLYCPLPTPNTRKEERTKLHMMSKKVHKCWDDEGASLILQLPKQEKRYVFVSQNGSDMKTERSIIMLSENLKV